MSKLPTEIWMMIFDILYDEGKWWDHLHLREALYWEMPYIIQK